jgi:hypothetical protein
MMQPAAGASEHTGESKLPRRDWFLLPLLGLLTIVAIAVSTETIARRLYPEAGSVRSCVVMGDASTGSHAIPNTACHARQPETQWIEYRFNGCGHRAGMECGPKTPGTYRIVLAGSSVAFGSGVQREQTFAALLPAQLSRATGRRVELYNASMGWGYPPRIVASHFDQVLSAQPDLILWVLTPLDIEDSGERKLELIRSSDESSGPAGSQGKLRRIWLRLKIALAARSASDRIRDMWALTRTATMVRHLLYENESQGQYVKSYLMNGDSDAGFLKTDLSAQWKNNLEAFDEVAAEIEGRAQAAGVPLVAALVPNRAQAAMISMGEWPQVYDPFELDRRLRAIIVSHGGTYIDLPPDFRGIPNPEHDYFPVDGHPDAGGHAILSSLLARHLTDGAIPALQAAAPPKGPLTRGR